MLAACLTAFVAGPARAQGGQGGVQGVQGVQALDDGYSIMRPEPWVAPKYRSPRGTPQRVEPLRPAPEPRGRVQTSPPPALYVPQTGLFLPNQPSRAPETSQDKAIRCADQASSYGALAGDRTAYIGSCVNQ